MQTSFYGNIFKVGLGLMSVLWRFQGFSSKAVFLYSSFRHFLFLVVKIPLRPRTFTLAYDGMSIRFKEFTGKLGNIKTVFQDEGLDLDLPNNAVVLDVGANVGIFTLYLIRKYGRERFRSIHLFEPNPDTFARLTQNIRANGLGEFCHCEPYALSNEAGTFYMDQPHGYTVLGSISPKGQLAIQCRTLEEWTAAQGLTHIHLLKVDVEGHELQLMQGAMGMLEKADWLFIEVKRKNLDAFFEMTHGHGFREKSRAELLDDVMLLLGKS